jgi:tetratricopeptide (TPR) repeat protein
MTEDRHRHGSRLLAFVGLWLLLSGLLLALSFVDLVLFANAVFLIVGIAVGTIWTLRRIEFERKLAAGVLVAGRGLRRLDARLAGLAIGARTRRLGASGGAATLRGGRSAGRHATRLGAGTWRGVAAGGAVAGRTSRSGWGRLRALGVRRQVTRLGAGARERATGLPARADHLLERGLRGYALAAYRLQFKTAQALNAGARLTTSLPRPGGRAPDESFQARRLNALGTQLRRQGDHEQAAVQYRVALEIVRDLGDEQAEAMTLNNLALALAQGGAEEEAVSHLEQARDVLHDLGDDEHEGQVLANLGIVHRRQGHSDVAETLLVEALDKLPPESPVYRQVERELVRAS